MWARLSVNSGNEGWLNGHNTKHDILLHFLYSYPLHLHPPFSHLPLPYLSSPSPFTEPNVVAPQFQLVHLGANKLPSRVPPTYFTIFEALRARKTRLRQQFWVTNFCSRSKLLNVGTVVPHMHCTILCFYTLCALIRFVICYLLTHRTRLVSSRSWRLTNCNLTKKPTSRHWCDWKQGKRWLPAGQIVSRQSLLKPTIGFRPTTAVIIRRLRYSFLWETIGASLAIWDHTVLPAVWNKWTRSALTPASQAGTRFTYEWWRAELT